MNLIKAVRTRYRLWHIRHLLHKARVIFAAIDAVLVTQGQTRQQRRERFRELANSVVSKG